MKWMLVLAAVAGWAAGAEGAEPALRAVATSFAAERILAADEAAWSGAPETALLLQRTPPIYESDPPDDGFRPSARVSVLRDDGHLWMRLRWTDPTESEPAAPARVPDAGDSAIYREHSKDVERFADAACVMVPREPGPRGAYPAIMMGDTQDPVDLFYWNRRSGFQRLSAAGRATVQASGPSIPGGARRRADGWEVVLELPTVPGGTPVAFAFWDGDRGQRSGLKYYSLWYEVTP